MIPKDISSTTDVVLDSVSITIPSSGYIFVTMYAYINVSHVTGNFTDCGLSISDTRSIDDNHKLYMTIPSGAQTFTYYHGMSLHRVDYKTTGTFKYYLVGDKYGGGSSKFNISKCRITAMYFPTIYGSVDLPSKANSGNDDPRTESDVKVEVRTITLEDHNAEIQRELEAMKALYETRFEELENQVKELSEDKK